MVYRINMRDNNKEESMQGSIAKELRNISKLWNSSEPRSFNTVPDGNYTCQLVNMEVGTSKNGRLQVMSRFKIADGKQKGQEFTKFDGIDSETNISWFKGYAEVIGLEVPNDPEDLPAACEAFVNDNQDLFNVTVRTKDEYQNVFVRGMVEAGNGASQILTGESDNADLFGDLKPEPEPEPVQRPAKTRVLGKRK